MLENIALIKEVHEFLPTKVAQEEASKCLKLLELDTIGLKRMNQCSSLEIFAVSLIRALMSKEGHVIIVTPFHLIDNLREIETVITIIKKLPTNKNILLLDTLSNETHYKGSSCNIVK